MEQLHSVEIELDSVRIQLEEETQVRVEIERKITKITEEVHIWKSKYESEVQARNDEVEEYR